MNNEKTHLVMHKLKFTLFIIVLYIICRQIPLNYIDMNVYTNTKLGFDTLISSMLSGNRQNCYIMSLGITPYITSMLLVQIAFSLRSKEAKARISMKLVNQITGICSLILALIQAISISNQLIYVDTQTNLLLAKIIVVDELVTGAFLITWLTIKNKEYGIGGPSVIIFINILDNLLSSIYGVNINTLVIPICISIGVVILVVFMDTYEKRIPLQRISVHNIYADKNYLAIKLAPIGAMPIMFASACFMLPQTIVSLLLNVFTKNQTLLWLKENLVLTEVLGVWVYLGMIIILTIIFSFLFISPKDISDQLLKNGDSLVGIHPNRDTTIYLSKILLLHSIVSALLTCTCLGISLYLGLNNIFSLTLALLPSTVMFLTGILCSFYQEIKSLKDYDSYKRFI